MYRHRQRDSSTASTKFVYVYVRDLRARTFLYLLTIWKTTIIVFDKLRRCDRLEEGGNLVREGVREEFGYTRVASHLKRKKFTKTN